MLCLPIVFFSILSAPVIDLEPFKTVNNCLHVSWAKGPAYVSFKESFESSFVESFKKSSNGRTPNRRCVEEAAEITWDVIFKHHFGNLKVNEAEKLIESSSDPRWRNISNNDQELMKKLENAHKKLGKWIQDNPTKYLE